MSSMINSDFDETETTAANSVESNQDVMANYTNNNDLVGITHSNKISVEGSAKGTISVNYPKDSRERNIKFDKYIMYVNEVYSEKKN